MNPQGAAQVRSVVVKLQADNSGYDRAQKQSARVTEESARKSARAIQDVAKAQDAAGKAAERAARAQAETAKGAEKAARESARAQEKAARDAAKATERAAREAAQAEKQAAREAAQEARKAAQEQKRAAQEAAKAQREAAKAAREHRDAQQELGQALTVTGAAMAALAVASVAAFADFDAQMSRVSAATNAATGDLQRMREAALQAGADTKFSATEAAVAEEALAKAGVSVTDMVNGGLRGAMDLAAAGNLDLGEAADIAAQAMNTFKLKGGDVPRIADALAAGAGKAVGEVSDLGMAIKQSGLVASQLGLDLEDTVGTLSAFADNALLGSDAGTSFKVMLQRMAPTTAEAADLMDKLDISFFDSQGQFVGIAKAAGILQDRMKGLSQEQRLQAMSTIFGSDAIRAANILFTEGEVGVRKYIDGVKDTGYAQEVAAKATDNLKGDLERLKGSLETSLINSGGAAAESMRHLAQVTEGLVDAFDSLPAPLREGLVILGGLGGAASLMAGGFLLAVPRIAETRAAMATLNITAATTKARLGGLASFMGGPWGLALTAATIGIAAWAEKQAKAASYVRELTDTIDKQSGAFTKDTRAAVANSLEQEGILKRAQALNLSMKDVTDAALGNGDALARLKTQHAANAAAMNHHTDQYAQLEMAFAQLMRDIEAQNKGLDGAAAAFRRNQQAMGVTEEKTLSVDEAAKEYQRTQARTADVTDLVADSTKLMNDALDASTNLFLSGREAARAYQESLDAAHKALKRNGRTLDDNTAAGRENARALDKLATDSMGRLQAILADDGPGKKFQRTLADSRRELYDVARQFGMSKEAARAYTDRLLRIPKAARTKAELAGAEKAKRQAEELYNKIRSLQGHKTITVTVKQIYENYGGEEAARGRSRVQTGSLLAEGGDVPAVPGSRPGVDSVHALLVPHEYVMPERPARLYRPELDAMRAGTYRRLPGYAAGGEVVATGRGSVGRPAGVTVTSPGPRVVMVPVSETHTTAASVHVGTVVTQDARSFIGWGTGRSFSATGGVH